MRALTYRIAHDVADFALELTEVAEPTVRELDVLVDVRAVGVNPGEASIRRTRSAEPGGRVLLGWEFAGVVVETGAAVAGFSRGDRVFGTGDLTRDGSWAERVAIDHRILARIPDGVSFADAASLPIAALTSWEALFRDQANLPAGVHRVLVVGGAGAVGSMATQLLKARTGALVISTASRPESKAWSQQMGADFVIDHRTDVPAQLTEINVPSVDMILSTAKTTDNVGWVAEVLRPFGHLAVVDGSNGLDLSALTAKSASLHTELVFSRIINDADPKHQGNILETVSALVTERRVRPIATTHLQGLTAATMRTAHTLVETGRTVGKVVITM